MPTTDQAPCRHPLASRVEVGTSAPGSVLAKEVCRDCGVTVRETDLIGEARLTRRPLMEVV